jgi:deoxyribose-phosphate aldolase
MITEYCFYDTSYSDEEIKELFKQVSEYHPSLVSVFPYNIKLAKSLFDETKTKIASVIDYPFGISDSKLRQSQIEYAKKAGADCVNIVAQPNWLCNRKYDKFREDIRGVLELATKLELEVRYILEYRVFTYDLLYKVAQILKAEGITTIYPATGFGLDDINDNLVAAALINKKVPINIICNGNIWNQNQILSLNKAHLFGLQVNSLNALKLLYENQLKS